MDVFEVRDRLIGDYASFTSGFLQVRDRRIRTHIDEELGRGLRWPDPWLALNPTFKPGGTIDELADAGLLHDGCRAIFRLKQDRKDGHGTPLTLHQHQREAVEVSRTGQSYVLTTGTGSGKSLGYIVPIVDRVLREGTGQGIRAIVVYPMNALANSQMGELTKFLEYGFPEGRPPVSFARYTGQEDDERRRQIMAEPPDVILTNYVMLELMLTRPQERRHLIRAASELRFLVLDELHTYRGRQGADVALLVRRVRDACEAPRLQCVGTSATMASGGTLAEQRADVARVATRLFGDEVTPERVIVETLRRSTEEPAPDAFRVLADRVRSGQPPQSFEELRTDPLCSWIETAFGLDREAASGRLIRRRPNTVPDASRELAALTGVGEGGCAKAITSTLLAGSRIAHPDESRRSVFAFRLHQFLSKGDTVYVSLEPEAERHITSQYQVVVPEQPEKVLLPLSFCRECGQEYLAVTRVERDGHTTYLARQDTDASGGDTAAGYLYVSGDYQWPLTESAMIDRLPESWLVGEEGEQEVDRNRVKALPQDAWLRPDGTATSPGDGLRAAFIPSPFRFCLRCKVSYESARGSDYSKLASLGSEGRSSATTVLSASLVRNLRAQPDLRQSAQKLLAFSDNRQDASLQAGHFNDFVQVGRLRSALYRAVVKAGPDGLSHEVLAHRVVEALELDFAEYAAEPTLRFAARDETVRALREVVNYRLYQDLERGWRITMPNLEQTGLLVIDYASLDELAADTEVWRDKHPALVQAPPEQRSELCRTVLDEMRRALAIRVDCLTRDGFDVVQRQSDQRLREPWALAEREPPTEAGMVWPRSRRRGDTRRDLMLSGLSAFGRYLRRQATFPHLHRRLSVQDAQDVIRELLEALVLAGLVHRVTEARDNQEPPGYRVNASGLRWCAGSGEHRSRDPLRMAHDTEAGGRVNPYFRQFYQELAGSLGRLHAAEHTAQVPPRLRLERETAFRTATLPVLYCSPTMELGVDIADLNAVVLRNVPPTPANYAQRSGRAGRSGQPALVVTYCTTGSGHDQYYFRRSERMVAGAVAPPRLDLTNEDLLRAHVQAIWLAETGQDLHRSLISLLDASGESPTLEVQPQVRDQLADTGARRRAVARVLSLLEGMQDELKAAPWYDDGWTQRTIDGCPAAFDRACDRWRTLYQAALTEAQTQSRVIQDASAMPEARQRAEGRRREAEGQLRLLRAEDEHLEESDFYSYRYFASEGFLPGYSFPRLPLAAYIPGARRARRGEGDYLQRPRFLAISEFGPGALVYHEGARYEVSRVQLPIQGPGQESLPLEGAKRCETCGYHHTLTESGPDLCEACGATLPGATTNLLRMQTVYTRRRERISSDEEERRRAGYEIVTAYRFAEHGERPGHQEAEVRAADGAIVAALTYGDTATIRRANVGYSRRKNPNERGYFLDVDSGRWLSRKDAEDAVPDADGLEDMAQRRAALVIPYVEDRRNALVFRLAQPAGLETTATLQHALKRATEASFDLEDSELATDALPTREQRGAILYYESAEGGAGVLRRLVGEPGQLAVVAHRALELLHYDPESGVDLGSAAHARERCEKACYDCLLSYSNQLDHRLLDRHLVGDVLGKVQTAVVRAGGEAASPEEEFARLLALCDSDLERMFLRVLRRAGHRLPTDAQRLIQRASLRPDFTYSGTGGQAAVFVDGPGHDAAAQRAKDGADTERLEDLGWNVFRFRHDEEDQWEQQLRENAWVFGPGVDRTPE